ncbi:multiheme c-type cytochrome [Granulicella sp. L46]|uniref:multiheme c-type cytochrome n=1 Tax=Granulicella sp. L46 TaxID=1641865 RepID=UPI0020B10570|nr:multiheme c-type cytochrome [Granulicella sp. L46]
MLLAPQALRNALMTLRRGGRLVLLATVLLPSHSLFGQLSTEDHLAESTFWPTQGCESREGFVGAAACAKCHAVKSSQQESTQMALNMMPASASEILRGHSDLTFAVNKYKYKIENAADQSNYSVSDGTKSLSFPLAWAFGAGRVGQSYLFKKDDGQFYEARVTYFANLKNLGFTPSRELSSPSGIDEAMYRPVGQAEAIRCFSCHATASTIGGHLDESHLIPGVSCEACHSPGRKHVLAMDGMLSGKPGTKKTEIFNPAHLAPTEAVEFCGACHGDWWDVKLSGVKGVSSTRSAPARLVTSKCWGKGEARLTCTACHDPHQQLKTESVEYDEACLQCHVNSSGAKPTASHPGPACPTARERCTSCHMPKTYVPEMHSNFTDHRIRIVRSGEPFPE